MLLYKAENYAKLIAIKSLNIKAGDKLVVWCDIQDREFANIIADTAYRIGACDVEIYYVDTELSLLRCSYHSEDLKSAYTQRTNEHYKFWKDNGYKLLWLYRDMPECLSDISEDVVANYYNSFPPIPWSVVNIPNIQWAKKIYPDVDDAAALQLLWDSLFYACRIGEEDAVSVWNKHISELQNKASILNNYNFKKLIFKNSLGTNLTVPLAHNHIWITCTANTKDGGTIVTNIPTEEVFTAPDKTGSNGTVYITRPLLIDGNLINNAHITFENGRVVNCTADSNQDILSEFISSNEGADLLGEVAIVPNSTPVSQLPIFWYDSSFDENAGCHLALGYAYPQTVSGVSEKINKSAVHLDFVIGSDDMCVTGITNDGKSVTVMCNGEWVI